MRRWMFEISKHLLHYDDKQILWNDEVSTNLLVPVVDVKVGSKFPSMKLL